LSTGSRPKLHHKRKVVLYVPSRTQYRSPPPDPKQAIGLWENLPQIHRQQLLWLLSQLLERQVEQRLAPSEEVSDECDDRAE
jgi:hypothetical protein